jgi:glycosyltransferase involved in cell wall biosynthesis
VNLDRKKAKPPGMSLPNIILYTDSDVFAGTERHIYDLALGLREQGADAAIACPRPGALAERALAADMRVLAIAKRGTIDRHAIRKLADQLRRGFADVIHAHNGRTHVAAAAAVKEAGRGACVMTQHFLAPARTTRTGPKAWISSYLHRRASANTAHVIAISDAVREAALARGDTTPDKITTIHNGIAPLDLPEMPDAFAIRNAVGVNAYAPLIFCAARLQAEKDIPTLIAAVEELRNNNTITPTPQCVIAGAGDLLYNI